MKNTGNDKIRCSAFYILFCLILVMLLAPATPALADTALMVQVAINGDTTTVAEYSSEELSLLPQTQLKYSSLDATSSPVSIIAKGVTVDTLLTSLGIPGADVVSVRLESSDGWQRSFSADDYLRAARYYYSGIVDGYDTTATDLPAFAPDTDKAKQAVAAMLALESYEGRFESSPDEANMTTSGGIRFCFGQTAITDSVMLNYGKRINRIVFALNAATTYLPPAASTASGDGSTPASNPGVAEEIENQGLAADTLTVTVGYYGGTYYTKKVFSLADLQAMRQVRQAYSYIDNMPAVCLDSALGVRLTDILDAAGIDVNSVQAFHFYCTDVARTWYLSMNKDDLLDTIRYYYPHLPQRWNYDEAEATAGAAADAVPVDAIIAWQDNWRRFATQPDFDQLTDTTRFRLLFGQTDVKTPTGSRSAKWIHTIAVTLGGTAPAGITLDASALELEVGSEFQLNATLKIDDNTTDQRVTWSSSDPNVVSVDRHGRIKVLSKGQALVTATTVIGGLCASAVINSETDAKAQDDAAVAGSKDETAVGSEQADQTTDIGVQSDKTAKTNKTAEGASVFQINGGGQSGQATPPKGSGVQNWRVYEMSKSAIALADIKQAPNPLALPTAVAAVLLLFTGAVVKTVSYFKQL